jgi:YgiT-type zinc finger domain-containing protein
LPGGCGTKFREKEVRYKGAGGKGMNSEKMRQSWNGMSEEIISGIAEWRQQHPQATFRELEEEVDRRLSVLRAKMLADAALSSVQTEWESGGREVLCPECGKPLEKKGKKKRRLQTRGGQEVELEREYGVCPACGQGIFPPR